MRLIDANKLIKKLEKSVEYARLDYQLSEGSFENALANAKVKTLETILDAVKEAAEDGDSGKGGGP